MSLDINWKEVVERLLEPERCCQSLTEFLNSSLPPRDSATASFFPFGNFKVTQFDLQSCPSPEVEIVEVTEVRDEYLLACGFVRSIHSPPPMTHSSVATSSVAPEEPQSRVTIDSASLLFDRSLLNGTLAQAVLGDGVQVTASLSLAASDCLRAAFEAEVMLNVPAPAFLSLPFRMVLSGAALSLQVSLVLLADGSVLLSLPRLPTEFDFQLAVEVGDPEKHVLRNVGKIERFLLDQMRLWMAERLLFPRYQLIRPGNSAAASV